MYTSRNSAHEPSHTYLEPIVSSLLRDLPAGATVLDLGCGNGSFLSLFRGRGWHLFGTDFSSTGIEIAKQSYPGISFFRGDIEHAEAEILKFTGRVDAIISTEVIEHVYDPRAFIRTAAALLKPGGLLVVTTPYHGYLKNLMLALTGKLDQHFTVLWDGGHIKFWSRKTLSLLTRQAGLEVVEFRGSGRFPYLWKSMCLAVRKPIPQK